MKKPFIMIYIVLFVVLFLFFAMIWHWQMAGTYFICRDKGLIQDFLPPFVHPGVNGDLFLKPQGVVYTIWALYAGMTIALPGFSAWLLMRLYDRELKKSWM